MGHLGEDRLGGGGVGLSLRVAGAVPERVTSDGKGSEKNGIGRRLSPKRSWARERRMGRHRGKFGPGVVSPVRRVGQRKTVIVEGKRRGGRTTDSHRRYLPKLAGRPRMRGHQELAWSAGGSPGAPTGLRSLVWAIVWDSRHGRKERRRKHLK